MRINLIFVLAFGAVLAACGPGRPRAPASDGERLYVARCTACHAEYEPSSRTPDQWKRAVAKMERWKKVKLTDPDRALILSYLTGAEPKLPAQPAAAAAQ